MCLDNSVKSVCLCPKLFQRLSDGRKVSTSSLVQLIQVPGKAYSKSSVHCSILHHEVTVFLPFLCRIFQIPCAWKQYIVNPRSACAARVTVLIGLSFLSSFRPSVRLSVCLLPSFLPQRATERPNCNTNEFSATLALFKNGNFRKSAAFKSYRVKTKSTSQYANYHRHTSTGSARSVYLEGTRSHNEGRVSTHASYLLLSLVPVPAGDD